MILIYSKLMRAWLVNQAMYIARLKVDKHRKVLLVKL